MSSFSFKLLPSSTPNDIEAHPIPHWPHPSIHPHHIEPQAKHSLSSLQRHYNAKSGDIQEQLQRENSVVIFPVLQAGQFHIREEEECLQRLFYHLDPANARDTTLDFRPLLNLTSGYFGLSKSYKDLILRSHILTRIICASPKVRFFYHLLRSVAHCDLRRMGFTVLREYRTVYQTVTRGSSRDSWQPYALLNFKILSLSPGLWSSRSGTGRAGHTTQRVRSPLSPVC